MRKAHKVAVGVATGLVAAVAIAVSASALTTSGDAPSTGDETAVDETHPDDEFGLSPELINLARQAGVPLSEVEVVVEEYPQQWEFDTDSAPVHHHGDLYVNTEPD